ncbi:MAG TPA: hypothetical protein VGB18_04530 [Candidatus Thermoplasmatota archaeon]
MAWEWLVAIDGVLGLVVAATAIYLAATARGRPAVIFFSVVAFMATFRIFYFILQALFGIRPSAGVVAIYPGTENILGIGLVGAMVALRDGGLQRRGSRALLFVIFAAGLIAILLQFQGTPSAGPSPFLAPLFLATIFVAATGFAAAEWVSGGTHTSRENLVFILGPVFAWSLNDALRIGHGAWAAPASGRTNLGWFTLIVAVAWLIALLIIAGAVIQDMILRKSTATDRKLLVILLVGSMAALFQLLTSDADGMRAIHLVLDCLAITAIGWTIARRASA